MSNKVFVPVDPEGFGCGLLLGFLIKFWRETLLAIFVLLCLFYGCGAVTLISENRQRAASATEFTARQPLPPTEAPLAPEITEAPLPVYTPQESLTVYFQDGVSGATTVRPYYGKILITVKGQGQAAGGQWSDAFYIFADEYGQDITPWHPTELYNWSLWINGEPVDSLTNVIPSYNPSHEYKFFMNVSGGHLNFAVGDAQASDNSGQFKITIYAQ